MKKLTLIVFSVLICFSGFSQKANEFKLQDVVSGKYLEDALANILAKKCQAPPLPVQLDAT